MLAAADFQCKAVNPMTRCDAVAMDAELMPNSRGINDGDALLLLVEQGLGRTQTNARMDSRLLVLVVAFSFSLS